MNELQRSLGRIEGKLDAYALWHDQFENRLAAIEKHQSTLTGVMHRWSGAIALVAVLFGWFKDVIIKTTGGV